MNIIFFIIGFLWILLIPFLFIYNKTHNVYFRMLENEYNIYQFFLSALTCARIIFHPDIAEIYIYCFCLVSVTYMAQFKIFINVDN